MHGTSISKQKLKLRRKVRKSKGYFHLKSSRLEKNYFIKKLMKLKQGESRKRMMKYKRKELELNLKKKPLIQINFQQMS